MAKKQKRRSSHSPAQARRVAPQAPRIAEETRVSKVVRRPSEVQEFNPDYTPIIRDLKRIGTLAGIFFVVLVVLSFFL